MCRSTKTALRFSTAILAAFAVIGCSGGSGSSGMSPVAPVVASSPASISGQVVSVPTGSSRGGIKVTLDAPSMTVSTDADGRFRLDSVAPGDRSLSFKSSKIDAKLGVSAVGEGQSLQISIALTESTAEEAEDDDEGDDDQGDDDDGDDDQGDDDSSDDDSDDDGDDLSDDTDGD